MKLTHTQLAFGQLMMLLLLVSDSNGVIIG